jgi:hypothetical protein
MTFRLVENTIVRRLITVSICLFTGGLGSDLVDLIDKFKNGVKYDIRSDTIFSQWGIADMVIARVRHKSFFVCNLNFS